MAPVEIAFLIIIVIFGVVGAVRGFSREIGVTVMLLVALLILQLIDHLAAGTRDKVLAFIAGSDRAAQLTAKAIIYTLFLIVVAFITYQGTTLDFPTAGPSGTLGLLAGLLNGWLFAGSIWYYLAQANWPVIPVCCNYDNLYLALSKLLPPEILDWRYLIALVLIMMILRVWH
jgi:uncharacterized membrane protein required for colicin V production